MMKVVKEAGMGMTRVQLLMNSGGQWIVKRWGNWPPDDDLTNWKRPLPYINEHKKFYGNKAGALAHYSKHERVLAVRAAARALRGY